MTLCGIGYDVHRLVEGRKLVLGGVEIPYHVGLDGHSDADVLSHALADAVLGAIGERDIGFHFPNSDESIRGISSLQILERVRALCEGKAARIVNVDGTLIAQAPKIGPYVEAMRDNVARAFAIPAARVGIKATTNEWLGFVGREEGIAAFAVASVEIPEDAGDPALPI